MKQIAITGGKGGTGKSTVAILLANKLRQEGKKVVLCDSDIECPNDYLLLSRKLNKPVKKTSAQFPVLDKNKCQKCGLCVRNCRSNAIFQPPGDYPIFLHGLCSGCGLCWHLCPHQAIKVERKVTGAIFKNKVAKNFWLVTGRVIGVVDETGPVASKTKEYALKWAKKIEADYLLIDTAVGIHCGVIRSLFGADLAYAVTEPTPLGAHDLELIINLLKQLEILPKIVINQSDLGNKKLINPISKKTQVAIEHEIPYSEKIVRAYSQGKLAEVNIL
jgi:MinD superfamily P-loop ATPase